MQQITRGDYLKDLITIYIENNLQTSLTDLYESFIFQCGEIQQFLTPAQVIKISLNEQESQLLKNTNVAYLAGITKDGHKETFNGSLSFNTRGEVVFYEPPVSTVQPSTTETSCDCNALRGFFSNCSQPAIKAYFSLNYVPTKLSELTNDTDFVDSVDVAESISIHNASTEAHPYIQSVIADTTEALTVSIQAETTARIDAVSLAISTTEAYTDSVVSVGTEATKAYADSIVSTATTATEAYTDSVLQSATTAINTTIGDLSQLDTSVKSSVTEAINSEVSARQGADNDLQTQIDGLAAASDVTDIVGTYAELQSYDTQHLNDNDIIKVLSDSTHEDEPSYYRFDKDTDTFSYIGSESAAYTKAQSDSIFVTQTTEINGHALTSDINLTASDVGALANTTTINDLTSTAQQNALNSGVTTTVVSQVGTNATNITTINGKIPSDASSSNKLISASTLAASIANFANKDLNNLSTTGTQKLRSLNAYANTGELLTDAEGLADVKSYAHSVNKTGVDTIKADDYTPEGSIEDTITADGVASGFTTSNYIAKSDAITISSSGEFHIDFKFDSANSTSNQYIIDVYNTTSNEIILRRNSGVSAQGLSSIQCIVFVGGAVIYNKLLATADKGEGYIEYKDGTYTYVMNGVTAEPLETSTKMVAQSYNVALGCRPASETATDALTTGIIDLNSFKIYVDGDLVYQPCLKIPYTESKTGSKIVDSIYRDRVNDMAEQFGYANYYTLNEDSGNFTLPQVELYGLINKLSNCADYGNSVTTSDVNGSTNAYTFGHKSLAVIKPATPASTYTISVKQAWTDTFKTINGYGYMTLMFDTGDVVYTSVSATIDVFKVL